MVPMMDDTLSVVVSPWGHVASLPSWLVDTEKRAGPPLEAVALAWRRSGGYWWAPSWPKCPRMGPLLSVRGPIAAADGKGRAEATRL
jgi:hypothetical protein